MTKFREYYFDVEIIIDHDYMEIMGEKVNVSTHRMLRGLKLDEMIQLIKDNKIPFGINTCRITFNIRGVNY